MQRADKEGLKLREAVRKKKNEEVRSVKLNIMSLQDKQFEVKGNIFNIYSESEPSKQLTSVGWKNLISAYQLPFVIEVKGKKILRIGKES